MSLILLTAFEPFGRDDYNSSAIVLDMVGTECGMNKIDKMVLPVVYEKAFDMVMEHASVISPDYIVCMGQAGGRKRISVERIAVNINSSETPDNEGNVRDDTTIDQAGLTAYMTDIPYEQMRMSCTCDSDVSYSAGTFVCNDIFYRLLFNRDRGSLKAQIGFIHLPYTEHFGKIPYIEAKMQTACVEGMLSALGV